jgi:putative PIN family toxin of toxin-antitoxin system
MKIFFDTNVLVSAFITKGVCSELFNYCLEKHVIYTSEFVLDELEQKLVYKFKFPENKIYRIIQHLNDNTVVLKNVIVKHHVLRDKDDDNIIAAAVEGKVDCIVTGDKDLLCLKNISYIAIINPGDFPNFEKSFVK